MSNIYQTDSELIYVYIPEHNSNEWIDDKIEKENEVTFQKTFTFPSNLLVKDDSDYDSSGSERSFLLGTLEGDFYKIDKDILGLRYDLRLHKTMKIDNATFIAHRGISIFKKIDKLIDEGIVIGGDEDSSIPISEFEILIKTFPNTTELNHYSGSRIERILKDYFGTMSDPQRKLTEHLENQNSQKTPTKEGDLIKKYELQKFQYVRNELEEMLNAPDSYKESDWQKKIVIFLKLIFPKYIAVLEKVAIQDFYSNPTKSSKREIDIILVDASGTIDIFEIKQPFPNCILSVGKYRDNYTPKRDLSGSIMQVEKYIFHLSKWGRDGESAIQKNYKTQLPPNFQINITNPNGIILLGRDKDFTSEQKLDFEIIKRKYTNITDVMTYDDLLRRLNNMISSLGMA